MFRDDEMLINSCKDGSWHPFMTAAMQCPFTKCMLKPFGSREFPSFFCQTWNDLNQLVSRSAKLRMLLGFLGFWLIFACLSVLFSDIDNSDSAALHTLWEYRIICWVQQSIEAVRHLDICHPAKSCGNKCRFSCCLSCSSLKARGRKISSHASAAIEMSRINTLMLKQHKMRWLTWAPNLTYIWAWKETR